MYFALPPGHVGYALTMRKVRKRWFARVFSALSSSRWVGWGGVSLLVGGALGIATQVFFVLMFLTFPLLTSGFAFGFLRGIFLLQSFVTLLVAAGLIGLYAVVARRPGRPRMLAGVGLGLVVVSAAVLSVLSIYGIVFAPRYIAYDPTQGIPISQKIELWAGWGWPLGATILGIGALGTRELGRWRPLPLVVGLFSTPAAYRLFLYAVTGGNPEMGVGGASRVLLDAQPILLNVGWVALGYVLLRTRGVETATQTNERLARRLYEEAWGRGELAVLDQIVAPDVVDHYHHGRGLESLRKSVANLRVSFPDLRFVVEGQEAEENKVTTRWTMGGTDRGGVLWYPPTGKAATFSGTFTDRFEGGRIVEHWGESDTAGLLRRLGLPTKG